MSIQTINPQTIINISQAAELLGVSRVTVYAMILDKRLTPVLIAGRQFFKQSEVKQLKDVRDAKNT